MSWEDEAKLNLVMENEAGVVVPVLDTKDSTANGAADDTTPLIPTVSNGNNFATAFVLTVHRMLKYYWNCYVCLILSAAFGFALSLTSIKALSKTVSVFQIGTTRGIFISVVLMLFSQWKGLSLMEFREKIPLVVARCIVGSASFILQSYAVFELPLSDVAFMCNSYPGGIAKFHLKISCLSRVFVVVTAMLSWSFGMESLGYLSWIGIIGCVVGNAIVAHPPVLFGGDEKWDNHRRIGILAAVLSNLLTGIVFILVRYVGKSVSSLNLTAYAHVFLFLMTVPFVMTGIPEPVNTGHSIHQIICYAVLCITGLFSQVIQSRAMQIGPPTKTTALMMTNMIFSGLIGIAFLSESISWLSGIGALVILISVILVTVPDSRKGDQSEERYQPLLLAEEMENEI